MACISHAWHDMAEHSWCGIMPELSIHSSHASLTSTWCVVFKFRVIDGLVIYIFTQLVWPATETENKNFTTQNRTPCPWAKIVWLEIQPHALNRQRNLRHLQISNIQYILYVSKQRILLSEWSAQLLTMAIKRTGSNPVMVRKTGKTSGSRCVKANRTFYSPAEPVNKPLSCKY